MGVEEAALTGKKPNSAHTAELELNLMLAECKINFPGGSGLGCLAGLAENKANSANPAELELGLSWAELGNYFKIASKLYLLSSIFYQGGFTKTD